MLYMISLRGRAPMVMKLSYTKGNNGQYYLKVNIFLCLKAHDYNFLSTLRRFSGSNQWHNPVTQNSIKELQRSAKNPPERDQAQGRQNQDLSITITNIDVHSHIKATQIAKRLLVTRRATLKLQLYLKQACHLQKMWKVHSICCQT